MYVKVKSTLIGTYINLFVPIVMGEFATCLPGVHIDNLPNMVLSVATLSTIITIVNVESDSLSHKMVENKTTHIIPRILKMWIPHLVPVFF